MRKRLGRGMWVITFWVMATALCAGKGLVSRHPQKAPPSILRSRPQTFREMLPQPLFQLTDNGSISPLLAANSGEFFQDDRDRVSASRAALFSFVLPGAGQWYAGARNRAGVFLGGEGIAWALFGYFETVGAIKRNDSQAFARVQAGIDPTGKNDDFYRTITFYDSRSEYNAAGRIIRPSRPYYPDTTYWNWQWSSSEAREKYRRLRNQSSEAFNRGRFAIGALILNRIVAAFDAWRTARSVNRRARMERAHWKIKVKTRPLGRNPQFKLTFVRSL